MFLEYTLVTAKLTNLLWAELLPQNSYVKALAFCQSQNVTVSADRAF